MNWSISSVLNRFSNLWRPSMEGGQYFYKINGGVNVWQDLDYLKSFVEIPELNAVINYKARAFSNGCLKIVNKKGKEVDGHEMQAILDNPNWFQAQKEFMMQTKQFHEIFGNEYLYTLFPVGFKANRTKALFTLPPNLVVPEYDNAQPFFVHTSTPDGVKYYIDLQGQRKQLPLETICHVNDNRVFIKTSNDKTLLKGDSKMNGLQPAINNIRFAYESRGVILKHRGALGILSNQGNDVAGVVPLPKKEKERIQQEYQTMYGGLDGQFQIIVSNANLKWQQMAINPDKLGLYQECEEAFNKILDAYAMPSDLFVRSKGSTYENQKQADKRLYQNTIIPEANEWATALNKHLMAEDKAKIIVDYSHLPCFQDDLKVKSDALASMVNVLSRLLQDGQITNLEYREELFKIGLGDGKELPAKEEEEPAPIAEN